LEIHSPSLIIPSLSCSPQRATWRPYINLAVKREKTAKAKETRRLEAANKKRRLEEEKPLKVAKKKLLDKEKVGRAQESAYWKEIVARGWGDQLQVAMKSGTLAAPSSYTGVYCGSMSA
jgi:hypothetical protein